MGTRCTCPGLWRETGRSGSLELADLESEPKRRAMMEPGSWSYMGVSRNGGVLFGGPHVWDPICAFILGARDFAENSHMCVGIIAWTSQTMALGQR